MKIYKKEYWSFVQKHLGLILFLSMCTIALFSFDEYGICWDGPAQRFTGLFNYEYIMGRNPSFLEWTDRDYGVAFELPLIVIERIFNITDSRDIFLMRHFITHLFFLIGAFFCFKLVDFLYKNKLLATIGFLLIILHPRLYAHSFFNTKDIPFMTMFLISLYFNAIAFRKKKVVNFVVLGISIGLLINLRIMGTLLLCCIVFFLIIDAIKEKKYNYRLKLGLIFLTTAAVTLYATWPYLWTDPIKNFTSAFVNMSKFRWEGTMLFNGEFIKSTMLGWNYIPVWFSITTPIFYLFAGSVGIVLLIIQFIKTPAILLFNTKDRNNIFFLICFLAPILAVIILKSVLYDGWRHMYFIYPSFVMLAIYGLDYFLKKNKRGLVVASSVLTLIFIVGFMVKNNPHQHLYFNYILRLSPPEHIRKNFEMDYWGVSYRQSLEYILKNDDSPIIKVNISKFADLIILKILPSLDRARINFVPFEDATYFVTNYRWHPQDYEDIEEKEFHSIKVANNTVNKIFKLK